MAGGGADCVVEVGLGGFGFAFHFPDAGVGEVVGLIGEGRDEGGAEPLDAVVGLSGEVAVVEGDDVGTLVAAVAGFFGVFAGEPIESEKILAAFPGAIFHLNADARVLQAIEGRAADFVAEAIPKLEPVERNDGGVALVAESVNGETPDDGAAIGEGVEAESVAFDRGGGEDANVEKFVMVRETVVEKFLAEKTVEARNVDVERGQLWPSFLNCGCESNACGVECKKNFGNFLLGRKKKEEAEERFLDCVGRHHRGSDDGRKGVGPLRSE